MIRIHYCAGQINVAEERSEPPAPNCRCRQFITLAKATLMVKNREASWVVVKRKRGYAEVVCSLCGGDKTVANCAKCEGKGVTTEYVVWNTYNNDVVLVSELPNDEREKKRTSVLKKKTPRVATIEAAHIYRAYVENNKEAKERIEEYGRLILDARLYAGKNRTPITGVEPENDASKGQGRDHDWGRAI